MVWFVLYSRSDYEPQCGLCIHQVRCSDITWIGCFDHARNRSSMCRKCMSIGDVRILLNMPAYVWSNTLISYYIKNVTSQYLGYHIRRKFNSTTYKLLRDVHVMSKFQEIYEYNYSVVSKIINVGRYESGLILRNDVILENQFILQHIEKKMLIVHNDGRYCGIVNDANLINVSTLRGLMFYPSPESLARRMDFTYSSVRIMKMIVKSKFATDIDAGIFPYYNKFCRVLVKYFGKN